jgi:hypothetical protein
MFLRLINLIITLMAQPVKRKKRKKEKKKKKKTDWDWILPRPT